MILKNQLQIWLEFDFKIENQNLQLAVAELFWKPIPLPSSPYSVMGW